MSFSRGIGHVSVFVMLSAIAIAAHAAQPGHTSAQQKVEKYGIGHKVNLILASHVHVEGKIADIAGDSVAIMQKGASVPQTVSFASIVSVRDRSSVGSRLKTGPCVGPITLAIAAPIVATEVLLGH